MSTAEPPTPPRRVRVTAPAAGRAGGQGRGRSRPAAVREVDDGSALGEVYLQSLLRAQLGLGLRVVGAAVVLVTALPLLSAALVPDDVTVAPGLTVAWIVLAVAVFPLIAGLGAWYVRHAERNERDFVAVLAVTPRDHTPDQPDTPGAGAEEVGG